MAIDETYESSIESFETGLTTEEIVSSANVAELLDDEKIMEIADFCVAGYENDEETLGPRLKKIKKATDLTMMIVEPKNYPWPNSSNVKLPILAQAAKEFAEIAYPAIVQNGNVVKCKIYGDDEEIAIMDDVTRRPYVVRERGQKAARANRVSTYMNYQVMEEMYEWEEDMDRLTTMLPIAGNLFKKVCYDPVMKRSFSRLRKPNEVIVDYSATDIRTANRVTDIYALYPNQIVERIRSGLFLDVDLGISNETQTDVSKAEGKRDVNAPHLFLEQHTNLDIDDDGYPEPYIVTIHKETGQLVRIVANFGPEDVEYNDEGLISRITKREYFVDYKFMPSPDGGFYGIGFGELLLHLNETGNTLVNQLVDAGTLSNTGGGFIGKGMRMKGGVIRTVPGEWRTVPTNGDDIRKNMVPITHPEPSQTLFVLLGFITDMTKSFSGVDRIADVDASGNQAALTTMAMVERGVRSFKTIYRRVYRSLKHELKILYRLNSENLTDEKYKAVIDDAGEFSVAEDFTSNDYDIVPVSDPNTANNIVKRMRSQVLLSTIDHPLSNDRKILEDVYSSADIENVEDYILQPDPQPSQEEALMQQIAQQNEQELQQKARELDIKELQARIKALEAMADIEKTKAETANKYVDTAAKAEEINKTQIESAKEIVNEQTQPAGNITEGIS